MYDSRNINPAKAGPIPLAAMPDQYGVKVGYS